MKKWSQETIQSPLAKAKGYGSAHDGVEHWMHQRVTAIANIPLVLWLVCSITQMQGASYTEFTTWLAEPINAILMIIFVLSAFYHAKLGAQVIVEDYIHHEGFKMLKLIGMKIFFFGVGVACIFSILKIAFAG